MVVTGANKVPLSSLKEERTFQMSVSIQYFLGVLVFKKLKMSHFETVNV